MLKAILFNIILSLTLASALKSAELDENSRWLLDRAQEANLIYKTPYKDEPWLKQERWINGKFYTVNRNNHGLAHAVRKAFLIKNIVQEMRAAPAKTSLIAEWLQKKSPEEINKLIKKLELAALYHRAGRENENSRSSGTQFEKDRFDRNMRSGALLFKDAAQKSGIFENEAEIEDYMQPYSRYELQQKRIPLTGDAKYIDQILYTTHILDSKRVNADWNDLTKKPSIKSDRLLKLADTLGYGYVNLPLIEKLDKLATRLLEVTGDRDKFQERTNYSDDFFIQAHDPELLVTTIRKVDAEQ